jgi:hypothetical protein
MRNTMIIFAAVAVVFCLACDHHVPVDGHEDDPTNTGTTIKTHDDPLTTCGNGLLDENESCDIAIVTGDGVCPVTCDDGHNWTEDTLEGDDCDQHCVHNVVEGPLDATVEQGSGVAIDAGVADSGSYQAADAGVDSDIEEDASWGGGGSDSGIRGNASDAAPLADGTVDSSATADGLVDATADTKADAGVADAYVMADAVVSPDSTSDLSADASSDTWVPWVNPIYPDASVPTTGSDAGATVTLVFGNSRPNVSFDSVATYAPSLPLGMVETWLVVSASDVDGDALVHQWDFDPLGQIIETDVDCPVDAYLCAYYLIPHSPEFRTTDVSIAIDDQRDEANSIGVATITLQTGGLYFQN